MKLGVIIFFIFTLVGNLIYGQRIVTLKPPKQIKLETPYKGEPFRYLTYHYDLNANLPTGQIKDMSFDADGRLWITSPKIGFAVIDGCDISIYGKENGLLDRFTSLFVDHSGKLWAGGNGTGVVSLESGLMAKWYLDTTVISDMHIYNIVEDRDHNIWVASRLNGVTCIMPDTSITYTINNTKVFNDFRSEQILVDENNIVWFINGRAKKGNIIYIENGEAKLFNKAQYGIDGTTYLAGGEGKYPALLINNNTIYTLTTSGIDPIAIDFLEIQPTEIVWAKYDREGNLFCGNGNQIFKIVDNKGIPIISPKERIGIQDVEFDLNNSIWIGTHRNGIYYIPDFNVVRLPNEIYRKHNDNIKVFVDEANNFYATSMGKLNALAYKKELFNNGEAKLTGSRVTKEGFFFKDSNGEIYCFDTLLNSQPDRAKYYANNRTIYFEGLDLIHNEDDEIYTELESNHKAVGRKAHIIYPFHKEDERYYLLIEDEPWVSYSIGFIENGIYHPVFDPIKVCNFKDSIEVENIKITSATYINDTTFWVTTWGAGLYTLTPNTCTNISEGFGSTILYIHKNDFQGNLWIGGIEGGANYVDVESNFVLNLTSSNGLIGTAARSISCPDDGSVIIGTDVGLGYYELIDPNQTVHSEADFFKKYKLTFFSVKDGLMGDAFTVLNKDKQNRIWLRNSQDVPQIIDLNTKTFKPTNLIFEHIHTVETDEEVRNKFYWIPGIKAKNPGKLRMNYGEVLHVNTKAVYYKDSYGLSYQWKMDEGNWSLPQSSNDFVLNGLPSGEHTLKFRALNEKKDSSNEISLLIEITPPFYQTAWFIFLVIFSGVGILYLIFRWRLHVLKQRQKQLELTVEERTEEIRLQKIEIETQHGEIRDSIAYAKRIQEAILPPTDLINKCLPENFVLYKPKDVVAGDFYWLEEVGDTIIFAAADCTGHGVPGAMVSVVCHNALNRSVREFGLTDPNLILDKTRELVLQRFEQGKREVNDGMDIAVCALNKKTNELKFSGANNGLYLIRDNELIETKGDKQPIGKFHDPKPFTQHSIELQKEDTFYLYTDGFADQFGGDKGKKLKSSHFKRLLIEKHKLPLEQQFKQINEAFDNWKGELEQVDDVCVIGVKI